MNLKAAELESGHLNLTLRTKSCVLIFCIPEFFLSKTTPRMFVFCPPQGLSTAGAPPRTSATTPAR